jgi:hypothetical protein
MLFVSCDENSTEDDFDTSLNGTWVGTRTVGFEVEVKFIFHNGNYEWFYNNNPIEKGTYKINDSIITFNRIYIHGDSYPLFIIADDLEKTIESKYYSKEELKEALSVDDEFLISKNIRYVEFVAEFSIDDDKATFVYETSGSTDIFTRKALIFFLKYF